MQSKLPFLGLAGFIALGLSAQERTNVEKDPYVELYKQRVELARLNVSRQEARNAVLDIRFARAKRGLDQGVVAIDEVDEMRGVRDVAIEDLKFLKARVIETEGVLRVVRFMVEKGREDIPLFNPFQSDVNRQ